MYIYSDDDIYSCPEYTHDTDDKTMQSAEHKECNWIDTWCPPFQPDKATKRQGGEGDDRTDG